MRRLGVILVTMVAVTCFTADLSRACRLFARSWRCCRSVYVCEPIASTGCGSALVSGYEAGEVVDEAPVESDEAASVEQAPSAPEPPVAEETPVEPAAEDMPPVIEEPVPAEKPAAPEPAPSEEPAPETPAPAKEEAPATPVEPAPAEPAKQEAPAPEVDDDKQKALDAFFGESSETPEAEGTPAPAEAAPAELPADEVPAPDVDDDNKKALDDFFGEKSGYSAPKIYGVRKWTDVTGQYHLQAKFLAVVDDGTVRLEKTNGRWVRLPLAKLSRADQLLVSGGFATEDAIAMNP